MQERWTGSLGAAPAVDNARRASGVRAADQRRCRHRSSTGCGEKKVRGDGGHRRALPRRSRRGAAPDRLLDGAGPRGDPRIQAFRNAAAVDLAAAGRRGGRPGAAGTLTELAGIGPSTANVITDAVERRDARTAREARGGVRTAGQGRRRGARAAQGRPALPLRLVRRRLTDRGDGLHRHRAGARLPRAHRPLAPADGRARTQRRAADAPARRRRGDQRPPRRSRTGFTLLKGIEVDILDDGGLDQTDEMLAGSTSGWPACTASCGWTPPR